MTVLRPITAIITAIVAGLGVDALDKRDSLKKEAAQSAPINPTLPPMDLLGQFDPSQAARLEDLPPPPPKPTLKTRLRITLEYGFIELLADIGGWFLVGVALASAVSTFVPDDLISTVLGRGFVPMLATLALSLPLYICATASTPVAAALAAKGLTPGAAMVLLVAGPATNLAALIVTGKLLGKKALAIYLAAIIVCSLAMGGVVNLLYDALGIDITSWLTEESAQSASLLEHLAAITLLALIFYGWRRQH